MIPAATTVVILALFNAKPGAVDTPIGWPTAHTSRAILLLCCTVLFYCTSALYCTATLYRTPSNARDVDFNAHLYKYVQIKIKTKPHTRPISSAMIVKDVWYPCRGTLTSKSTLRQSRQPKMTEDATFASYRDCFGR